MIDPEIDWLGTLGPTEYHLSAEGAQEYFRSFARKRPEKLLAIKKVIYEAAEDAAGPQQKYFQVMRSTWERLREGDPVSDRYLLGLCWYIRDIDEATARTVLDE